MNVHFSVCVACVHCVYVVCVIDMTCSVLKDLCVVFSFSLESKSHITHSLLVSLSKSFSLMRTLYEHCTYIIHCIYTVYCPFETCAFEACTCLTDVKLLKFVLCNLH